MADEAEEDTRKKERLQIIFNVFNIDDWKSDHYRWNHYGSKTLKTNPIIRKSYYVFVNDEGAIEPTFKRYSYTLLSSTKCTRTVVHYEGNDSVATHVKTHVKTCPSVLTKMEGVEIPPPVAYKREIAGSTMSSEHHVMLLPRNKKHIKNLQSRFRQKMRITHAICMSWHMI